MSQAKTTTDDTLAVRVSRVIEDEHGVVAGRCEREPSTGRSQATKREAAMRDWGMAYGVAFGLQLGADPNIDWDTAAEDALDAARAAFARWSVIPPRLPSSLPVDEALVAYERAHVEIQRALMDSPDGRRFMDKMQGLVNAIGMPEPTVVE